MNRRRTTNQASPQGENSGSLEGKFKIVAEAFSELFELLEQYAPTWYTQQHHDRALAAQRLLQKSKGAATGQ